MFSVAEEQVQKRFDAGVDAKKDMIVSIWVGRETEDTKRADRNWS